VKRRSDKRWRSRERARVAKELLAEAELLSSTGEFEIPATTAAPDVERPPEASPPPSELWAEAESARDAGHMMRAVQLCRAFLAAEPGHIAARRALAQMLAAVGDADRALTELDRAVALAPGDAGLRLERARVLGDAGRYAAAQREVEHVLTREPEHTDAVTALGSLLARRGLWGEAARQLRRSVELDAGRPATWCQLGEALNRLDELSSSLAAFERAAALDPLNPRALQGMGRCWTAR
jgi:predicted Zn-dependent protease